MKKFAYSFPIPIGKVNEWLAFAEEVNTTKNKEFTEMHARVGVTKESWYLQKTRAGYDVVIYTEAKSEKIVENFKNDHTEFSNWFRNQVSKIQGIELNEIIEMPKLVLDWKE